MTINAKSDVLNDQELDAVSGGVLELLLQKYSSVLDQLKQQQQQAGPESGPTKGGGGGQNDPANMFQQILQQLTQGG